MQARRSHDVAIGGDGEAAGLDEEGGLFGVWDLFEEGDDVLTGGFIMPNVSHGCLSIIVADIWVVAGLEKEVDGAGWCGTTSG
jgi:hypothetical protein